MSARSPNTMDDVVKRPPPSPSDKAPAQKKPAVRSRTASEEPTPKTISPVIAPKNDAKEGCESSKHDAIDMDVFAQIIDLDDGDLSFVRTMVTEYLEQVEDTFQEMNEAMQCKDLKEISQLGHFLKGSSAALGVKRVSGTCEKIQNTAKAAKGIPTEKTLEEVMSLLERVHTEFRAAKGELLKYLT